MKRVIDKIKLVLPKSKLVLVYSILGGFLVFANASGPILKQNSL
ncbi:hypothetical protein MicvaDRAFT_1444 [Microcoleus vaginatus FGP-2]|nr:hypothetical protein MicvaDRAFT_1444 [Microcoleus vaginatus FGP-2]